MMGGIITGILFLAMLFNLWKKLYPHKGRNLPPEPDGGRPIIGHLPLLNCQKHIAHTLAELATKHGPIFTLRMGMQRVVVVSSRDAVWECFTTNDKSFANRPKSSVGTYLVYDHASFGFSNGPYWREMRKLASSEVLSARRLDAMKNLRVSEITMSISELYSDIKDEKTTSKVVISHWIEKVALNIIMKTIAGKRYGNYARRDEDKEVEWFRGLIHEFTFLAGEFVLSDVIPIPLLRWLDPQGHIRSMKRVSGELDKIIERWIEEHVERRSKGDVGDEQDFIHVMLSTVDDDFVANLKGPARLTIIKATVVNVILGGFDTTSVFLTWVLSLLVNNKHVLKQAQQEIHEKVGNQRWVQESDIKNLPYLQVIIKEALRMYPPLPLSVPHEAVEDCQIGGYFIPKGTLLFTNLMKLHRDPQFWPEPDKFMPERFLTTHAGVDVWGKQFEFIPFGAGRRSCPGITFALQVAGFTIARLIQGFDFSTPGNQPVDMDEGIAITMPRANPLEVMVTPRLPSQLYES